MMRPLVVVCLLALAGCRASSDPNQPLRYPCDGGHAAECPGGWRCGLEQICVDPGTAEPRLCATSDDCGGGWRCRLDGVCYDPSREEPHLCDEDDDCAAGFRCSATAPRRCARATDEALVPRPAPAEEATIVAPLVGARATEQSVAALVEFGPTQQPLSSYVFVGADGGLWRQPAAAAHALDSQSTPLAVEALGSYDVALLVDGGVVAGSMAAPSVARRLTSANGSYLAAWDDASVTVVDVLGVAPTQTVAGPGGRILKVAVPPQTTSNLAKHGVFALTDRGLYFAEHDGGTLSSSWTPLAFPAAPHADSPDSGWPSSAVTDFDLIPASDFVFYLATVSSNGARRWGINGGMTSGPGGSCSDQTWDYPAGDAPDGVLPSVCAPGERISRIVGLQNPSQYPNNGLAGFECQSLLPDGGVFNRLVVYRNGAGRDSIGADLGLPRRFSVIPARSPLSSAVPHNLLLDEDGRLFAWQVSSDSARLSVPFFAGWPTTAAFAPDAGLFVVDGVDAQSGTENVHGEPTGLGLRNTSGTVGNFCAPVEGAPGLAIRQVPSGGLGVGPIVAAAGQLPPTFAVLEGSAPLVGSACSDATRRVRAVLRRASDGEEWLFVSASDRLFAAPRSVISETGAFVGTLPTVAAPAPGLRIDSLAVVSEPGMLATAWVLVQGRLFKVRGESAVRWHALEVPLPKGNPLAVFADGNRARVGFDDGRVFSLPGLIPLGPAVADRVSQFGVLCGRAYATAGSQLLRLDAQGGTAVGVWTPVPLPVARPSAQRPRFGRALLLPVDDVLYVLDDVGGVVRLRVADCGG